MGIKGERIISSDTHVELPDRTPVPSEREAEKSADATSVHQVFAIKEIRYDVIFISNLFDSDSNLLLELGAMPGTGRSRRFIVVDAEVDRLHGRRIRRYFADRNVEYRFLVLPVSEQRKTMETAISIARELDDFRIDRRCEPVIVIGGGVLMDLVGLVAGLYRRGTPYIRVPTTLVGLVDAGLGVKTGVNQDQHKNRLGAYHAPVAALLDCSFLATLDERHLVNGMAEILKIALVKDARLFELLSAYGRPLVDERFQGGGAIGDRIGSEVLRRAVAGLLSELETNLWEQNLDRLADYGHSISPTIEMLALPELLHGEAVAIDMALFAVLSQRRGLLSREDQDRILGLMTDLGLPICHPLLNATVLDRAVADTVRHRGGAQRLAIPVGIGSSVFVNDVSGRELLDATAELRLRAGAYA